MKTTTATLAVNANIARQLAKPRITHRAPHGVQPGRDMTRIARI